ncbi:hypothetical protein XSR1_20215 [Xenorhabdus szentirmaii DSM 16338]|uniref:Uncharacterized protein n=1 Tax=Xenorhabdus szentirmaii DSM 16338 TaxID=1427518 RepID=W1IVA0_9GAMM|nr:hypothetical protein XSR1_20215 [Xenorhabdus szentirmaii DSM 16338]
MYLWRMNLRMDQSIEWIRKVWIRKIWIRKVALICATLSFES